MQVFTLNKLDLELYHEKLDNGLDVYIIPKANINNAYVTFNTKFGSKHQEFVPIDGKKMIKVPDGVAHFLEHKLFEQEDGTNPFAFYAEHGADANANTSQHKTTYLFSSSTDLEKNLEFLLDFVQKPYFTDENVEKEKGIIEQEIKMYQDDPFFTLYEKSIYNSICKHPIKIPIIGTVESINSITKEDLYACYNTFYHPSNMFLVITGNVNPEIILSVIKNNQNKKEFMTLKSKIKIKDYNEPDKVAKTKEKISMNIAIPKVSSTYKINISNISDIPRRDIIEYILLYFEMKFSSTSEFNDKLKEMHIINTNLDYMLVDVDTHILIIILAETEKPQKLLSMLESEINEFNVDLETFERKKKNIISSYIYMSDSIFRINNWVTSMIVREGEIIADEYQEIRNLSFDDLKKIIDNINFDNHNYVVINPKK